MYRQGTFVSYKFNMNNLLDITPIVNSAQALSDLEDSIIEKNAREEEYKQRNIDALEITAENTKIAIKQRQELIDSQKETIEALKKIIKTQDELLSVSRIQLDALNNIFSSNEDEYACEREIAELIKKQIDEKHPLWNYVIGITQGVIINNISGNMPLLYKTMKDYLKINNILK